MPLASAVAICARARCTQNAQWRPAAREGGGGALSLGIPTVRRTMYVGVGYICICTCKTSGCIYRILKLCCTRKVFRYDKWDTYIWNSSAYRKRYPLQMKLR